MIAPSVLGFPLPHCRSSFDNPASVILSSGPIMGSMSFQLPNSLPPAAETLLAQACFAAGYDQTPSPTKVHIADRLLHVSRETDESGYLFLPWPVGPVGAMVTTTSTLRERPEPYSLLGELARGKLNQVRNQTGEWQEMGLQTPADFDRELVELNRLFASAVISLPSAESDAMAAKVLVGCYQAADQLARLYIEQMFATRQDEEGKLATRLSAQFLSAPTMALAGDYRRAFNAARIGCRWRDIEPTESNYNWSILDEAVESARVAGVPITLGPIIDLGPGMLPAWTEGWQGDLQTLAAFMCDYLETLVSRYKNHVRRWVVCAGFNHADGAGLSDDERLRLMQRLFQAALQLEAQLELVVSITQPWGDYLTQADQTISPLSFVDDLIRDPALKVSGVEIEIRNGTSPRGSWPRDLLDTSRMLDMFSLLGLPLEVLLSHPASSAPDFAARDHQEGLWLPAWRGGPTPEGQAEWGVSFAALALCKPEVRAVTWDHWSDADPHLTPAGGLITAAGTANPLLARLEGLRMKYLE